MAGPNDIYGLDEETGQPLTQSELGLAPPEPNLPLAVDEATGLPVVIGSGRIVSAQEAGSDQVSEAGSKGDPNYDPGYDWPSGDLHHFINGTVADPFTEDSEIQMDPENAGPAGRSGSSTATGFKGMTDAGIKMSDKLFGPAYERANQKNSVLSDQYAADAARLKGDTDIRKQALDELAQSEIEHFNNVAEIRRQQVELNTKARRAEELGAAQARANAEQYIAHYNQEMANLRPLLMQTGNPLGGLTAVQGGAMGAALFAQGFLGARYGIKVDVAGQINRWVEQEMAAHQNKVSNMMAGAQAQLKLYDIARQQGLDDQLTRDRLRGFAIDAMKSNLYMEAARYQSATAMNDAKVKAAELDQLQLKNEQEMRNKLIEQQMDVIKTEIEAAYKQGQLSLQEQNNRNDAWRIAVQAKHDKWLRDRTDRQDQEAKDAAANAVAPDMSWTEIVDPGKPLTDEKGNITGYQTTWVLDPTFLATAPKEVINETIKDVENKSATYTGLIKGLDSVREYLEQHPDANKFTLKHGSLVASTENLEYQRRFNAAVMDFRHSMFAGNLTQNEQELIDQFNGKDFLFQRGDNGPQALDDLENLARGKFESAIESKQGIRVNPKPGARRIDSMMNRTKARMAANNAPEAQITPGQEKAGRVTGIDRNAAIDGKFSVVVGEDGRPAYKADQTLGDRSIKALGAQVVVGMDHYGETIERGLTGAAYAKDGIVQLQQLRDTGDKRAAEVLERLYKKYPQLKE